MEQRADDHPPLQRSRAGRQFWRPWPDAPPLAGLDDPTVVYWSMQAGPFAGSVWVEIDMGQSGPALARLLNVLDDDELIGELEQRARGCTQGRVLHDSSIDGN